MAMPPFTMNDSVPILPSVQVVSKDPLLEIVGSCPQCGSPIYGQKVIHQQDYDTPEVRRSCTCRGSSGIADVMRTK